ncbi:MAG: type II toxin-antitoxin system PemK/MazF family toxin [Chitinophagaceae bacterium]
MSRKIFQKWDVVLVSLDSTKGSEISKTRPCMIVSPSAVNQALTTVIVVPLTTTQKAYPSRLNTNHKGKAGAFAFDQIRTIDKTRIIKKDGQLDVALRETANSILRIMFSEE